MEKSESIEKSPDKGEKTGLELLRSPFDVKHISKLPKGTKAQNQCLASEKVNCKICGGWHHPKVIHLDYVGHAALTDRLLDADPLWNWEPMAFKDGLPAFDATGGLWIKLTVCGHTRPGYGHAEKSEYKEIGSREKEVIGDALRNAAMRFGAALDLWHKGDLHPDEDDPDKKGKPSATKTTQKQSTGTGEISKAQWEYLLKIGKKKELTENEVIGLVKWCATQNNISPRHWQIGKLMLPEENFQTVLDKYLDAIQFPTEEKTKE